MKRNILLVALAAALTITVFAAIHFYSIDIGPDGWAYWQGSIMLAEGKGYVGFDGTPIVWWPPLYSAYLSLWIRVAGTSGLALICGNGLLVVLLVSSIVHTMVVSVSNLGRAQTGLICLAILFLALYVPLAHQAVLSDMLLYFFAVWSAWLTLKLATDRLTSTGLLGLVVANIGLVTTHNRGIAFVAALVVSVFVLFRDQLDRSKVAQLVSAAVFAGLVWLLVRHYFALAGSHTFGWGGRYSPSEYAIQAYDGVGEQLFISSVPIGQFICAALVLGTVAHAAIFGKCAWLKLSGLYCLLALTFTFALFNVVQIHDPFSGRFVTFLVMFAIPTMVVSTSTDASRAKTTMIACLLLLFSMVQMYRVVVFSNKQLQLESGKQVDAGFVARHHFASPDYRSGPPVLLHGGVKIARPTPP